jgi:hypothetical protein
MKSILKVYNLLLRLYPGSFRREFEEQMLLDFSDMAADAREQGRFSFVLFCVRELIDFPLNLLMAHYKAGRMFKILRSQPINYGLRGAFSFGMGFAVITLASLWISRWLFSVFDPVLQSYSVWYWETFQNERWIGLLDSVVRLLSYSLTGIFFGLAFSLLAGERRKRGKYFLAGSLTWLIPSLVSHVISNSFGWSFFLREGQSNALGILLTVLVGAFLGGSIGFAESDRNISTRYLVGAVIGYPLATYLFIRLLFYLWLEITPWFFISLLLLMIIVITSVVIVAISIDRKMLWTMVGGAIGCLFLDRIAVYIAYQLLHLPQFPLNTFMTRGNQMMYEISWAASEAIFGVLFGLLMGLIFGYQRKMTQPQVGGI